MIKVIEASKTQRDERHTILRTDRQLKLLFSSTCKYYVIKFDTLHTSKCNLNYECRHFKYKILKSSKPCSKLVLQLTPVMNMGSHPL